MAYDETREILARIQSAGGLPARSKRRPVPSKNELDIVLAWFHGRADTTDLSIAYALAPTAAVYKAATALRYAVIDGGLIELHDQEMNARIQEWEARRAQKKEEVHDDHRVSSSEESERT